MRPFRLRARGVVLGLAALVPAVGAQDERASAGDARALYLSGIDEWIGTHRFLDTITRTRLGEWSPVVIDVQSLPGPDASEARAVGAELGPWVKKLEEIFARNYATPLGLRRHAAHPLLYLLVLSSRGDYVNYLDAGVPSAWRGRTITFDPRQGIVVTYRDARNPIRGYRNDILWRCARALVEGHRLDQEGEWNVHWLQEGFLRYLAFDASLMPDDLEKHPLDPKAVAYVARYGSDRKLQYVYLHRLRDLLSFSNSAALGREVARKATEKRVSYDFDLASYCFHSQAYSLVHYLHHGEQGKRREAFDRLLERALGGTPAGEAALEVFGEAGFDELERGYWAYVQDVATRVGSDVLVREPVSLPPKEVTKAGSAPSAAPAGVAAGNAAPVPPTPAPEAPPEAWSPADLALRPDEAEPWIARAIHRALRGDFERALADLRAVGAVELAPDLAARVATETRRIEALRTLREEVLGELAANKKPLKLDVAGQKLAAKITGIDEGLVRLEANRLGVESVAKTELSPELVLEHASKEALAHAGTWTAAWPACVVGDTKWKRQLLNDKAEAALALRADAESYYPALQAVARTALALEEIAALAETLDAARASALREAVHTLWTGHGEDEWVRSRATTLRAAASAAIRLLAESYSPAEHLRAQDSETLPEGVVRLMYRFDDPAELEDFDPDMGFLSELRGRYPAPAIPDEETSIAIRGGALEGNGRHTFRHRLEFQPPLSVRWNVNWSYVEGKPNQELYCNVGICADSAGNFIFGDISRWIYLETKSKHLAVPGVGGREIFENQTYSMELRHDGEKVEYWEGGVLQGSAPAAEWKGGSVFVLIHSDMLVRLFDLEIEGRPVAASIEAARKTWIRDQIEALGIEVGAGR